MGREWDGVELHTVRIAIHHLNDLPLLAREHTACMLPRRALPTGRRGSDYGTPFSATVHYLLFS